MSIVIAVCGPDGAGKSTLTTKLSNSGFETYYGGKKSGHHLTVTSVAHHIYKQIDHFSSKLAHLYLLLCFYPIEYIENRARVRNATNAAANGTKVCFDRFVVDRMWQRYISNENHSFAEKKFNELVGIYGYLYRNWFPSIDGYIFLVPPADTLFDRVPEFYESRQHAVQIRNAYVSVATELQNNNKNVFIISEIEEPEELEQKILIWIAEIEDYHGYK